MADKPTGFPRSWLNNEGHVVCVARNCNRIWKTNKEAQWRYSHWRQKASVGEGPERKTDHSILFAMNYQRTCPHCRHFRADVHQTVKHLYEHERVIHQSRDTATISGFVKLLRKGLLEPEVVDLAYEPVHQRLLQKIMAWTEYHGPHGLANFWHHSGSHKVKMQLLESIIIIPNRREGRPDNYPMKPEEFLIHLPPQPDPRQIEFDWAGKRLRLKQMYENGEI